MVNSADYVCVLDTGSTDGTWEVLQEAARKQPDKVIVKQKKYNFFRFDVARNDSIELVPEDADLCWCLDIDEYPISNWRFYIEKYWPGGNYTRMFYWYAMGYDWRKGKITSLHLYDKLTVNARKYRWTHAVHEFAVLKDGSPNVDYTMPDKTILVYHHQGESGNREQYFNLLKLRIEEEPKDIYAYSFLLYELWKREEYAEIINLITNKMLPLFYDKESTLSKGHWNVMYAFAQEYLGKCYKQLGHDKFAEESFKAAIDNDKSLINSYVELGKMYLAQNRDEECTEILLKGLQNCKATFSWYDNEEWGAKIFDLLCLAFNKRKMEYQSYWAAHMAAFLEPRDERLRQNEIVCKAIMPVNCDK